MLIFSFFGPQDEDGQAGDQDQEEKRWNKRTQQMLHGLQVIKIHWLNFPIIIIRAAVIIF